MGSRYVILKMHHIIENQLNSLAIRMLADHLLLRRYVAQIKVVSMVPHVRNAGRGARCWAYESCLFPMQNIHWVFLQTKGNSFSRWEGIRSGRFSFD